MRRLLSGVAAAALLAVPVVSFLPASTASATPNVPVTIRVELDVPGAGSGPAVYNTYGGSMGWVQYGGTSVSSPLIASKVSRACSASRRRGFIFHNN